MRIYNYNDENLFNPKTNEELIEKCNGYIQIPIYYTITDDDEVIIDMESIMEEFQRTVYGIETVIEEIKE